MRWNSHLTPNLRTDERKKEVCPRESPQNIFRGARIVMTGRFSSVTDDVGLASYEEINCSLFASVQAVDPTSAAQVKLRTLRCKTFASSCRDDEPRARRRVGGHVIDHPQGGARKIFGSPAFPAGAAELLHATVYGELKRIARRALRAQPAHHTLRPTDLVHEAYLKLAQNENTLWQDKAHFLGTAACAMRHILVDYARRRRANKRVGNRRRVTLQSNLTSDDGAAVEVLELNDALDKLGRKSARMARVVELRVFAGMTSQETADMLEVSKRTVDGDWKLARLWLAREMSHNGG